MDEMHRHQYHQADRVLWGVLAIALGVFLTADNTRWFTVDGAGRLWPLLLIALGAAQLTRRLENPDGAYERKGAVALFIGLWGLLTELHIGGFTVANAWPLLVIGAGFGMMRRAARGGARGGVLCGLAAGRRRNAA